VDRPALNFAFSPCPNDTFAFHALVHGLVGDIRVSPHIDDIEALNIRAATENPEVTKVSIAA
jgi:1,4-dihydroxy-6-naphthoate synthase